MEITFLNEGLFKATDEGKYDCKVIIKALTQELSALSNSIISMIDLYTPVLVEVNNVDINDQKSINKIESKTIKNYDKGSEYYENINNMISTILTDKNSRFNILRRFKFKMAADMKDSRVKERRDELIKSCSTNGDISNEYISMSNKYKKFLDLWKSTKSKYFSICDKFSDTPDESMRLNIEYLGKIYSDVINLPNKVIKLIK